tara:strand:- start:61381 stop:62163 length:783 start_codon:yes stop_codon:yes gene_type:complete
MLVNKIMSKALNPCTFLAQSLLLILVYLTNFQAYAAEPNWQPYAELLNKHVVSKPYEKGTLHWVNYSAIKNDSLFPQVVSLIENYPIAQLDSRSEKLAFYINAYNILAIKMIVDHWPLTSIKKAGSLFKPVWKKPIGKIGGQMVSLQFLEDKIIRTLGEPRIHFAINCASISCPNLRREPYMASEINQQLQEQTLQFLDDPYKGLKMGRSRIRVSKIFKWFEDDFQKSGGIEQFILEFRPELKGTKVRPNIRYNWSVNGD